MCGRPPQVPDPEEATSRRAGFCITRFGACTAFTYVTVYMLAKSTRRLPTPKAPTASFLPLLLRLLPGGVNQFRDRLSSTVDQRLFMAHEKSGLVLPNVSRNRLTLAPFSVPEQPQKPAIKTFYSAPSYMSLPQEPYLHFPTQHATAGQAEVPVLLGQTSQADLRPADVCPVPHPAPRNQGL